MRQGLNDLESIVTERRQLEHQRSLHHWLHFWLMVHVPLSYALTVLTIVQDPKYLSQPFVTSTHFKREPDASKWMPTPCEPAGKVPR